MTVIVLGEARSGTSMLAGILSNLGVNMHHADYANAFNPKGCFEDFNIGHIINQAWGDLQSGLSKEQVVDKYRGEFCHLMSKRKHELFGWKNANTHFVLDIFLPFVPDPVFVCVFRDPLYNARSRQHLIKNWGKEDWPLKDCLVQVSNSVYCLTVAIRDYRDIPAYFTTYESIKRKPILVARQLSQFLQITFSKKMQKDIEDFILPNYTTLIEETDL